MLAIRSTLTGAQCYCYGKTDTKNHLFPAKSRFGLD